MTKTKTQKKDIKTLMWVMLFIALVGFYTKHHPIKPAEAQAPLGAINWKLPESQDKELTVYDQRRIVANKLRGLAEDRGFEWAEYLVNLSCCESLLQGKENNQGNYPEYSVDRGYFGINSYWHSEVSDEQARDLAYSANWTMDMIENGQQEQWMCNSLIKGRPNYSKIHCGV